MRTYSVAEVSNMLNVNAETIRRWIRSGKLKAKRAMGPGGNTMLLEDIIAFANIPPRAYLLPLESWLSANGFNYEKNEDTKQTKICDEAVALGTATAASGLAGVASVLTPASLVAGPIGIGVAGIAYGATKMMNRKNYQTYSIKLVCPSEEIVDNSNAIIEAETPRKSSPIEEKGDSGLDVSPKAEELNPDEHTEDENNNALNNMPVATENAIDIFDEIVRAKQLLDASIITQEEFADIKAKLIAKI